MKEVIVENVEQILQFLIVLAESRTKTAIPASYGVVLKYLHGPTVPTVDKELAKMVAQVSLGAVMRQKVLRPEKVESEQELMVSGKAIRTARILEEQAT